MLVQNVNSYGKTLEHPISFAGLLREVEKIEGLERIRFMTSHPKDLSDDLILAMKECKKVCKHMHLPLQSGSSRVLQIMNRHYDKERYLELVDKLKAAIPDIALTTDIIVGFPGETEEEFEETLSLANEVEYDSAFTFLYSVREGTPAAKREDQVPEDDKHARFNRLVDAINQTSARKNAEYVGRIERVLVDGASRSKEGTYEGRTDGFKLVNFTGGPGLEGQIVDVKITDSNTFSLTGEVV